jgi:ribonuclease HI
MKKVVIYTDGACSGNPGKGGWGAVLIYGKHEKQISGAEEQTTNNRMEMKAAIESLKTLKQPCSIDLYTDSKYLQDGINEWVKTWVINGWKNANKKPVKNADLWQELLHETARHIVTWHWVKGHAGDVYNEKADSLAREAIKTLNLLDNSKA